MSEEQDFDPWPEAAADLRDGGGPYQLAVVRREAAHLWKPALTWSGSAEQAIAYALGRTLQMVKRGKAWCRCLLCSRVLMPGEMLGAIAVLDFYNREGPTMTRCVCEECVGEPNYTELRGRVVAKFVEGTIITADAQVLPPR